MERCPPEGRKGTVCMSVTGRLCQLDSMYCTLPRREFEDAMWRGRDDVLDQIRVASVCAVCARPSRTGWHGSMARRTPSGFLGRHVGPRESGWTADLSTESVHVRIRSDHVFDIRSRRGG